MRALLRIPLYCLLACLAACGGTLGDVFGAFPPRVFDPDAGDDGDGGGGGGAAGLTEIRAIEANGGVVGDVRNIVVQTIGTRTIAFLSAGTGGVHVIDVTRPDLLNTTSRLATVSDASLPDPAAALAGGRADAVAVVDNTWLVTIAVGTGAANAVSVFNINTILSVADSGGSDLSAAWVAPVAGSAIAVPGTAGGQGGGVSGANSLFAVATGGPELALGVIVPGSPATWLAGPALTGGNPTIDHFVDVEFSSAGPGGVVYASVRAGDLFGIVAAGVTPGDPPGVDFTTEDVLEIEGEFDLLLNERFVGPGNFPPALAIDQLNLYATGDAEVHVFSIAVPGQPASPRIVTGTGVQTVAVAATTGQFAVGAGTSVRVFTTTGAGQQVARLDFSGTFAMRGVAWASAEGRTYILACAGTRGLRVLELQAGIPSFP